MRDKPNQPSPARLSDTSDRGTPPDIQDAIDALFHLRDAAPALYQAVVRVVIEAALAHRAVEAELLRVEAVAYRD